MMRFTSSTLLLALGAGVFGADGAVTTVTTKFLDADWVFTPSLSTSTSNPVFEAQTLDAVTSGLGSPDIVGNGVFYFDCGRITFTNKIRSGETVNFQFMTTTVQSDLDFSFTIPQGPTGIVVTPITIGVLEVVNVATAPNCIAPGAGNPLCADLVVNFAPATIPFTSGLVSGVLKVIGLADEAALVATPTRTVAQYFAQRPPGFLFPVDEATTKTFFFLCALEATTTTTDGGDPHLMTWKGERYDFHGECDLVLLHNPDFADGLGMDIHARTKIRRQWSFIDQIAIRIGTDVLEVKGGDDNLYWINGVAGVELPTTVGGYDLSYHRANSKQRIFTIALDDNQIIEVTTYKEFVLLSIKNAQGKDFGTSVGLHGNYHTGQKLARDGKTIMTNNNAFGQEWQLHDDEPRLFRNIEGPQYPQQQCRMPSHFQEKERRRRLGEASTKHEEAEKACAHVVNPDDRDNCIFDVLLTDDLGMAAVY